MKHIDTTTPRDERGRFLPVDCPDPNCGGRLFLEVEHGQHVWRCDGLTHDRDDDPLVACPRHYLAN